MKPVCYDGVKMNEYDWARELIADQERLAEALPGMLRALSHIENWRPTAQQGDTDYLTQEDMAILAMLALDRARKGS